MYKSAYLSLFNDVTDCIHSLNNILHLPNLSVDALRTIGAAMENLKDAQSAAEESLISQDTLH